jgi:hypothetical protein
MKQLYIHRCSNQLFWYANLVGQYVPYINDTGTEYRSREPLGYTNFVQYQDAQIIQKHWQGGTKQTCDCPDCDLASF